MKHPDICHTCKEPWNGCTCPKQNKMKRTEYIKTLTKKELITLLEELTERMIEIEELAYDDGRKTYEDEEGNEPGFYHPGSGERYL